MDAQNSRSANQISVIPSHDFRYETLFKLIHGFREQDAFIDHLRAEDLKALFESERVVGRTLAHSVLLF
jgi:hypothetical protein